MKTEVTVTFSLEEYKMLSDAMREARHHLREYTRNCEISDRFKHDSINHAHNVLKHFGDMLQ